MLIAFSLISSFIKLRVFSLILPILFEYLIMYKNIRNLHGIYTENISKIIIAKF